MDHRVKKIYLKGHPNLALSVLPGHFETSSSHVNYFMDISYLKTKNTEASEVAKAMAERINSNKIIDTIICLNGCEIIGAYLAQELHASGFPTTNPDKAIFIITPESNKNGQMVIPKALHDSIHEKNILVITSYTSTGITIRRSLECIHYNGGKIQGISSIFTAIDDVSGIPINSVFTLEDLPDYRTYSFHECPYCQKNIPLDDVIRENNISK